MFVKCTTHFLQCNSRDEGGNRKALDQSMFGLVILSLIGFFASTSSSGKHLIEEKYMALVHNIVFLCIYSIATLKG